MLTQSSVAEIQATVLKAVLLGAAAGEAEFLEMPFDAHEHRLCPTFLFQVLVGQVFEFAMYYIFGASRHKDVR